MLRGSPGVKNRHLVDTGNRAVWGARFLRHKFAAYVRERIFLQRDGRVPTLLRAVMHQPVLTDVEVTSSGTAAPLVGTPQRDIVLETVYAREAAFFQRLHFVVNPPLLISEWLQLTLTVVDDRVECRVEQRLATTDGDHRSAKFRQFVDPPEHRLGRDRFGEIVVFVAVLAGEIAAADGNNVR